MGKDILHRVGNGGHCGCETVSREVLPQVEIPEKWTQEPPCFAITIGVRLRSHTYKVKVTNFKKLPKIQILQETLHATHLLKLLDNMYKYERIQPEL